MAVAGSSLSRYAWLIVIVLIVALLGYAVLVPETNSVKITSVRLDNSYDSGCASFNITSAATGSSYTSISLSGVLKATSFCKVTNVGVETQGFSMVSSSTPITVNAGGSATLSMVMNTPTTYDGNLVICVYNGSYNLNGAASCPTFPTVQVLSFFASPNPTIVNSPTNLSVAAQGGYSPYTYSYSGLPTGCTTSNQSYDDCTPTSVGSYVVSVTVTDSSSLHLSTRATLTLTVNT